MVRNNEWIDWCDQENRIVEAFVNHVPKDGQCKHCVNGYILDNTDPFCVKLHVCERCNSFKEIPITTSPIPRPTWDTIWMGLARNIGMRSTCRVPHRQVGCVIVSDDNTKVLSMGYNGGAKGDDNSCEYNGNEKKVGNSRCTCVHAEMNALVKLDTSNPCKKRMYLTLSPCSLCYKLIVNSGITEVIYDTVYDNLADLSILDNLRKFGVKVRHISENN